ncbi:hypothetical protein JYK21_10100 [Ralstonia pickettii]|nr:hypothetical protein [Ralstonia pickettii]
MKKIKDERLVLKNLNNIRIAYLIQTLGIIGILGYDFVTKGISGMTDNPLWFVFIVTAIVSAYLSMNISVQHESDKKKPRKGLLISLIVLIIICLAISVFVSLSEGSNIADGALIGGIFFICGIAPILYIYHLRNKNKEDSSSE